MKNKSSNRSSDPVTRCARCGKTLTRAHWHGGKPYGVECHRLFTVSRVGRAVRVQEATEHDGQLGIFEDGKQ